MRQSKATQWIHVLLPVLRNTLRTLGDAPCRQIEALREQLGVAGPSGSVDASLAEATSLDPRGPPPCHDGTERPIPRPHDAAEQKACYSGKKKRHMVKNILLINAAMRILFLRETHPGSMHAAYRRQHTLSPAGRQVSAKVAGLRAFKRSRWTA